MRRKAMGDRAHRPARRGFAWALPLAVGLLCSGGVAAQAPVAPSPTAGPMVPDSADPDVAATVATVIGSAHHPELKWPNIPDVAPTMKDLYATEPDGLFWFDGAAPLPIVPAVVKGLALADEHGLDRADYDADRLAERWKTVRSERTSPRAAGALRSRADRLRVAASWPPSTSGGWTRRR